MNYDMDDVRKELVLFKKFLVDEPWQYQGYSVNFRKLQVMVDRLLGRVTESIETGGIKNEWDINAYAISNLEKAITRGDV